MKKRNPAQLLLTVLLAIALLTGGTLPALAEELPANEGAMDVVSTDETSNWETFTEEDWDAWFEQMHTQEKEEMGCPYPDGLNVNLNGQFLTFEDARPIIVDGRTMLPLRSILETMGAKVDWDALARTATATFADGTVVKATLDSDTLVVEGDETVAVKMDVPPLVDDNGRILIPVRFFAQAVGYDVNWDSYYQIVWLEDAASIVKDIDSRFTVYNHLLSLSLKEQLAQDKTYSIGMDGTVSAVLYGDDEHHPASAKSTIKGLIHGGNLSLDAEVSLTPDFIADLVKSSAWDEEEAAEMDEMFKLLERITASLIVNGEENTAYFKSNLLKTVEPTWEDAAWLQVDNVPALPDTQELMALLLTGLPQTGTDDITIGRVLYASCNTGYGSTGQRAQQMADIFELFYGDQYLKKSELGQTTTYRVSHTKATLVAAFIKSGLLDGDLSVDADMWNSLEALTFDMTLRERDDKILDGSVDFALRVGGAFPFEIAVKSESSATKGSALMELKGDYIGKLVMEMTFTQTESRQDVPAAPPSRDKVVSLDELMQG